MKIFNISRANKIFVSKTIKAPISNEIKPTFIKDSVEISTKQAKKSKLSKLKTNFSKLLIGLNKTTINNLEKLPTNDFLLESQKIIAKGMKLSPDFLPGINISPFANNKMAMMFDFGSNTLFVNNQVMNKSKKTLFSYLRHEMEHFRQNLQIIRTEDLGEKAIETYSKLLTKIQVDNFIKIFKTMPDSEISKLKDAGNLPEISLQAIKKVQAAAKQGDNAVNNVAEELINQDYPTILKTWQNIRAKVVKDYGTIKANTKEAADANKYFSEMMQNNGSVGGINYYSSEIEKEAYSKQAFAFFEYTFAKLFK